MIADDVTVVVATYGEQEWIDLALSRAVPSAERQAKTIHRHGLSCAHARNEGLSLVETEFVVFLDADDELEPRYVEAMLGGSADVRAPRVRCMRDGRRVRRGLFHPNVGGPEHRRHLCSGECLPDGNWIVVGAMARAARVREAGGFDERWPVYEDWALWLALFRAGASFEWIRGAIYRQHLRKGSRNHSHDMSFKNDVHRQIVEALPA